MRILGLITSNAHGGDGKIPRGDLFPIAMQAPLSKAVGEPVEIVARECWPNEKLPDVIDGWMTRFDPELVCFRVNSFWFTYYSAPAQLQKRFGRPGTLAAKAGLKAASLPWLAHNGAFRWIRGHTEHVVGSQAWFEPGEIIEVVSAVIRRVASHEGACFVVMGPAGGEEWTPDNQVARARLQSRLAEVDVAIAALCERMHVENVNTSQMAALYDHGRSSRQGDRIHLDREGHREVAEQLFGFVLGMVQRALAAREASEPAPAGT